MSTQLTDRQREIKERLDLGMGAREIAEDLGITRNAVYQQIQRLRKYGVLDSDYTPTGLPSRALHSDTAERIARALQDDGEGGVDAAGKLAIVQELRRTRDELDSIARRLSDIVPR